MQLHKAYRPPSPEAYLWIQKPTVLRVLPSNLGVITYYFVGFGATGIKTTILDVPDEILVGVLDPFCSLVC